MPGLKSLASAVVLGLLALVVLAGCGGGSSSPQAPPTGTSPLLQLTAISVAPPDSSVAVGVTPQFIATGIVSDGSKEDLSSQVTWSASNVNVASISNTSGSVGLATAVGPGVTTITAKLGGVSGSTTLTVTGATLVSIGVTATSLGIPTGLTDTFKATGVFSDNSTQDLTSSVTWSSSATTVASISNSSGSKGVATAVGPGATTVTATLGTLSGSATVLVTDATLVSIGVTPATPSVAVGSTQQLVATGIYTDNTTQNLTSVVTWTSSKTSVGSVSNAAGTSGLVTAVSEGSVTVTASLGSVSGSTTLAVTGATLLSIGVTPVNPATSVGLTTQFTAMGVYSDNTTQNLTAVVTWSSSDATLASISNASGFDGLATALSIGSVTVTATLGSVSGSTSLTVTSVALVSISVTPANPNIANGTTQQLVATGTYTDNSTLNLTSSVAWTSSTTSMVTVSNAAGSNGVATGAALGSATISAAFGNVSGSTTLTVTAATLVSIAVTPANPSAAVGLNTQLTATGTYTDNSTRNMTSGVVWSSSDPTVVTVSNNSGAGAHGTNGLATALQQGSVTIVAMRGTVSGSTTLAVTPATLVSIAVTSATLGIVTGTTQQFTAIGTYTDNSTQNLTTSATWTSSVATVASISNAPGSLGLATAGSGAGTTSISAALGALTSAAQTLTVSLPPAEYAYVADSNTSLLTEYSVGASGALTEIASIGTGSNPQNVAIDPTSRYVYVVNQDETVSEYAVGAGGALNPIRSVSTFGVGPGPIAVDPTGSYVYVTNLSDNSLAEFTIATGGMLSFAGYQLSGGPSLMVFDPTAPYVYALYPGSNTVSQYAILPQGALSLVGTVVTGNGPSAMVVDPTGSYLYVANRTDSTISQYVIGADGALTLLGTAPTGSVPGAMTADPTGEYLYVVNTGDNTLWQYAIGTGGELAVIGVAISPDPGPGPISVDPTGRYAYLLNFNGNLVSQYMIGATGVLTFSGSRGAGLNPVGMVVAQ
jgi:6-phosphogluconolactonase (cycloisomerase 2 family)/uncharacterized protein YjdB